MITAQGTSHLLVRKDRRLFCCCIIVTVATRQPLQRLSCWRMLQQARCQLQRDNCLGANA